MALFKKKPDPISERARALTEKISALEAEIKKLDSQAPPNPAQPRWRTTAIPHGSNVPHHMPDAPANHAPATHEPVFEEVDQVRLRAETPANAPEHYNELGVRKYDLTALGRWIRNWFKGPTASNPRLVNYLAAGGVQGLRPLRYEKRVARNRFLAFAAGLTVVIVGLAWWLLRHR